MNNKFHLSWLVFIVWGKVILLGIVKLGNFMYLRGWLGGHLKASLTLVDPSLTGYQFLKLNLFCKYVWHPRIWYLDNECFKHMNGNASQLINLKWKPNGYVTYGDNNWGRILGVGDIGGDDDVIIKDVLLVDGLKHNLLSISQLCDRGYKITFKPDLCLITYSKTSETVLVSKRENNVYMLNVSCITSSMKCLLSRNDESWLWHRRLAHIHMHHLNRLISKELVIGLPKLKFERDRLCEACQKGKQTKSSFKQLNVVSTLRPLEFTSHRFVWSLKNYEPRR